MSYILAPLLRKSTHTNLSIRNLPFWRPFTFWRPYAEKAQITQHFGAHALRLLCVPGGRHKNHWRRRPILNYRKALLLWGVAGCKPAVGAKRVENDVNAIQKCVPFTSKCSQKRWRLGLRPRPPNSEGERFRPSLTRRVGNGVKAIKKWVPFTP